MWILWLFSAIGIREPSPRAASSLALGDVRVALKQITLSFQRGRERDDRERRKTCGPQLYQAVKITRKDEAGKRNQFLENFRLFGAPHLALVIAPAYLGFYAALDRGLYVNTFMLAATSLGIDTIAQAAIAH